MHRVAVLGTTSWGSTLAVMLAKKGLSVYLLARSQEEAEGLNHDRENKTLLPGVAFPEGMQVTASIQEALSGADLLILAVPSQSMRANAALVRAYLGETTLVLSAAKGLELESTKRMSEVIAEELGKELEGNICVLSGPNLAREISQGLPATSVIAAGDLAVAKRTQEIMMTPLFRVYVQTDVVGVELGGTLKNIIAIGAGICDGLGYGDNGKAALMTRGLAEITRLGVAAGANPLTFAGLAGLGDLVVTCSSRLSRNHHLGEELAKGRPLPQILASMRHVAEGVPTTIAARQMALRLGIEMPITEAMYRVLFQRLDPRRAVVELMLREAKHELAGIQA